MHATLGVQTSENPQQSDSPGQAEPSRDLELVVRLLEALNTGNDRSDAAERFVQLISFMLPDRQVVFALGNTGRCSTIIDSRVGVVTSDTEFTRRLRDDWPDTSESNLLGGFWQLQLVGRGGGIALLAIDHADTLPEQLKAILIRGGEVFGEALWARPRYNLGLRTLWKNKDNRTRLATSAIVLGFLLLFPIRYRVPCRAVVQPQAQRLIAAPFDAQLDECSVRPGDPVSVGQSLAILDGRPLRIERESLKADLEKANKEYDVAMAGGRVADGQLARLERQRIQHQIDLIDDRLEQLTVRSPVSGVIVSGDLHKAQGMPFATGDAMFEVAPLDEMTFEIEIPEIDISFVDAGSPVRLRLSALGRSYGGTLERVYPKAEIRNDGNVFVGIWHVENSDAALRPGMEASATVYGPFRPLAWGWFRRVQEGCMRAIGW